MSEPKQAIEKLQQIHELWAELKREKWDSPASQRLLYRIFTLSAEYQSLVGRTESQPRL
jgi:hypothetical protein